MPMLNIWDLMMVIGVAQGMIMALVLWFRKDSSISSKFLAVIFFALAWATLGTLISEIEPDPITKNYTWVMRYVPFYLMMLIGPSLLWMIQSKVDAEFSFNKDRKKHYWAVVFNLLPSIGWMLTWSAYKLDAQFYSKEHFSNFIEIFYTYGDIIYWLHLLMYTFIARAYLKKRHFDNVNQFHKVITAFQLFLVAWFPFLVLYVSAYSSVLDPLSYYPIFIPMTILIYWLGFKWFFYLSKNKSFSKKIDLEKYRVAEILDKAMVEGLYLDSELTVKAASKRMEIPQRVLSAYINHQLKSSFNDYINSFRIKEVKMKLSDPAFDHYTVAAIAYDSGFKSIATFQRAFKSHEGISPKEFKKQLKNNDQIMI